MADSVSDEPLDIDMPDVALDESHLLSAEITEPVIGDNSIELMNIRPINPIESPPAEMPKMVDGVMTDSPLLPDENWQSDIGNTSFDPMDICPISPIPSPQLPETNSHSADYILPQHSTAGSILTGLPSLENPKPRLVASIDDPYPGLCSAVTKPSVGFPLQSSSPTRLKHNSISIMSQFHRPQPYYVARNGSTFGLIHNMRVKQAENRTCLLTSGLDTSRRDSWFRNGKKLTIAPRNGGHRYDFFISHKRSIDDGPNGDEPHPASQDLASLLSSPAHKYRRGDQSGLPKIPIIVNESNQMSPAGSHTKEVDTQTVIGPATRQDNGDTIVAQSQTVHGAEPTKGATDIPHVSGVTHEQIVGSQTGFEQAAIQPTGNAGFFATTSHPNEGLGHSPGVGAQAGIGLDRLGGQNDSTIGETAQNDQAFMSGAIAAAPTDVAPRSQVNPPITSAEPGDGQQVASVAQSEQPATAWESTWASLQDTFSKAFNSPVSRVMAKTINFAIMLTGSAAQRARKFFHPSAPTSPRRTSPAPISNLRALPDEQRRQLKDHQWRKERGHPIVEHYPFPELSFELPQIPSGPASPAESLAESRRSSVSQKRIGTPQQRRKRIGQRGPRAVSPTKVSAHGKSPRKRRPHFQLSNPQVKQQVLAGARLSRLRQARRERALTHALQPGEYDALQPLQPPTPPLTDTHTEQRSPEVIVPLQPKLKLKQVRFREPLIVTPRALRTVPAPRITSPSFGRVGRLAARIDIGKENVPPTPAVAKKAKAKSPSPDEILEPQADDWLRTRFPFGPAVSAVSLFDPKPRPLPPGRTESIYAAAWRKIQEEELRKQQPHRLLLEGPAVRPLPEKWETKISEIKALPHSRQIATTLSGDPLTKRDLATCYTPMAWLNDEIINSYLALIVDYLRRSHGNSGRHDMPRFHAFSTFFFSNLRDKGYESIRRWATRAKIGGQALLNVDTVFIPVHNNSHWTLIVVKPGEKTIEHFDSLGSLSKRHVALVQTWLRGELSSHYSEEEWKILPSTSPQQNNGSDCGVFLLSTAKAVAIGLEPLSYGAKDIALLRRKIVAELMNGGLEGDFDPNSDGETLL